jgi:hypothetical protein
MRFGEEVQKIRCMQCMRYTAMSLCSLRDQLMPSLALSSHVPLQAAKAAAEAAAGGGAKQGRKLLVTEAAAQAANSASVSGVREA